MVRELFQRIRKIGQQKAVILMYHQVCERTDDPWELAVHPDNFYDQLQYLKKTFNVVGVSELADLLATGKLRDHTIAITFDDGFKDNYTTAAPMLDWFNLPATFYVSTRRVLDGTPYWWEALQEVLFHSTVLPADFQMVINDELVEFSFRHDRMLQSRTIHQIRAWNYHLPIPNERIALYMLLWNRLKGLTYEGQNRLLANIKEWAGFREGAGPQGAVMSVREVQMLSATPFFSIGAHTVHHAMLGQQNQAGQRFEVNESKRQIEDWLGKQVNGFAYPYGNFNAVTQSLLREAGYTYAVSTESKPATTEADAFALPRFHVKNWCVYEFGSKLNQVVYG
jgi:peptidoglycan/xylan/chitin deacetylase (PgdA/CDA1 family)